MEIVVLSAIEVGLTVYLVKVKRIALHREDLRPKFHPYQEPKKYVASNRMTAEFLALKFWYSASSSATVDLPYAE